MAALRAEVKRLGIAVESLAASHVMGCDENGFCFESWADGCPEGTKCELRSHVPCAGLGSNRICYRDSGTCRQLVGQHPDGLYKGDPSCRDVDLLREGRPEVWQCVRPAS
jgi:hypothetical protein